MDRVLRFSLLTSLILSIFAACATAPTTTRPQWLTRPPAHTDEALFLVAYGSAESAADAAFMALDDVRRLLSARWLDEFDAFDRERIDSALLEELAARRAGTLSIIERYERLTEAGAEVYLLARYEREQLRADVASLAPASLVATPHAPGFATDGRAETDADSGAAAPDRTERAVQAPSARFGSPSAPEPTTQRPAERRAERSVVDPLAEVNALMMRAATLAEAGQTVDAALRSLVEVAAGVTVRVAPMALEATVGSAFPTPVVVEVQAQGAPAELYDFVLRYPASMVESSAASAAVATQAVAVRPFTPVAVRPATPRVVGRYNAVVEPRWYELLRDRLERALRAAGQTAGVELLAEVDARVRAALTINVTSAARTVPTAVVVVDTDIAGNPIADDAAARGTLGALTAEGFRVRGVELDNPTRVRLVNGGPATVEQLYDLLPFEVLAAVDRAVVGTARIVDFTERGAISVTVQIDATVMDLRRDTTLLRVQVEENSHGGDARAAIRAAFQAAGARLAGELVRRLP